MTVYMKTDEDGNTAYSDTPFEGSTAISEAEFRERMAREVIARKKCYGIWDTEGRAWMGNTEGPATFDTREIGREMARMLAEKMGWRETRFRVREYDGSGISKKDEIAFPTLEDSTDVQQ